MDTTSYKEERYNCQKCGKEYLFTVVSNIVCKECGWRVFVKAKNTKPVRLMAV